MNRQTSSADVTDEQAYAGNGYYCNPYRTRYEQYGFEHLDRRRSRDDDNEIECVVILGYN